MNKDSIPNYLSFQLQDDDRDIELYESIFNVRHFEVSRTGNVTYTYKWEHIDKHLR